MLGHVTSSTVAVFPSTPMRRGEKMSLVPVSPESEFTRVNSLHHQQWKCALQSMPVPGHDSGSNRLFSDVSGGGCPSSKGFPPWHQSWLPNNFHPPEESKFFKDISSLVSLFNIFVSVFSLTRTQYDRSHWSKFRTCDLTWTLANIKGKYDI